MNVGSISNINYITAAGRVNSPILRPSERISTPSTPVSSPNQSSGNIFFSLDGDRAEISARARGLSMLEPNMKPIGSGVLFASLPGAIPSPGKPADIPSGAMLPESANDAMLEALQPQGSCYTCENRKYVDQSDDASVSFQTPTSISPNMAAAAVASHENEHVRNEQARAQRDDREIVSQTVTLTYDICPECGRQYVSGGTTRTTSVGKSEDSGNMFDADMSPGSDMQ